MLQMVPRGLAAPLGAPEWDFWTVLFLTAINVSEQTPASVHPLSFLALHPHTPMTDPLYAPAHACILQSSLEKRQLFTGLVAASSIL